MLKVQGTRFHRVPAEGVGFEPTRPVKGPLVFKTSAFVRSAIPPSPGHILEHTYSSR